MSARYGELAFFGNEIAIRIVKTKHRFNDLKYNGLSFVRSKLDLFKRYERLNRACGGSYEILQVELNDLFSRIFAVVVYRYGYGQFLVFLKCILVKRQ